MVLSLQPVMLAGQPEYVEYTTMKTLIKRLFGITRLENEIIGSHAEIEAQRLVIWRMKWLLDVRTKELAEAYNLMHQARDQREAARESLVRMTRAIPGPWKLTKDKTKRYRRWEYPHAKSMWMTESEPVEQVVEIDGSDYGDSPWDQIEEYEKSVM